MLFDLVCWFGVIGWMVELCGVVGVCRIFLCFLVLRFLCLVLFILVFLCLWFFC